MVGDPARLVKHPLAGTTSEHGAPAGVVLIDAATGPGYSSDVAADERRQTHDC